MARASLIVVLSTIAGCATEADSPGTIYISDYQADAIVRYDGGSGDLIDVFASGEQNHVDRPANVRVGPDGNLYVAGFGRGDIARFDLATGEMMDVFFQNTNLLEEPVELLFHGDELVLLGNDTQNTVVVGMDGLVRRSFGNPTMRAAHDFAFGPDGLLYVTTETHPQLGTAIQVWDLATGTLVRTFGTADQLTFAASLAFDHQGDLLATDFWTGRVVRFDPDGNASTLIEGLAAPVSLDFGLDGKLYVLDESGLLRFGADGTPDGMVIRNAAPLSRPRGFTFVPD